MRSSKSGPEAPPPPYSYTPPQSRAPRTRPQERTPLLSPDPNPNPALPSHQYHTYTRSPYTQPPPPPLRPSFSQRPNNNANYPRRDLHAGSQLQAQEHPQYPRWIYRPIIRRDTSNSQGHKRCRTILTTFLAISIIVIIFNTYILFLPFHPPGLDLPPEKQEPVRIAVIGAGPGGVGAALRLSELFPPKIDGKGKEVKGVEVVVFEKSAQVGGRMNLDLGLGIGDGKEGWGGKKVEIEDVASSNLFADAEGLVRRRAETAVGLSFDVDTTADDVQAMGEKQVDVGFYDGNGIATRTTYPYAKMSWLQWGKLVVKYGRGFVSVHSLPENDVKKFNDMLKLVDTQTFDDVEDWITKAGLKDEVEKGAREKLENIGVGDKYRDEVVEAQVRRQLGQGTEEISALALSLALSREETTSGRTLNGSKMVDVLEQLLAKSGAEVRLGVEILSMKSEQIVSRKDPVWILDFNNGRSEIFDKLILTSPFTPLEKAYYRPIWQTFIMTTTLLKAPSFNLNKADDLPSRILPIPNSNVTVKMQGVHEVTYIKDIFGPDINPSSSFNTESVFKLYKITSSSPLSGELINSIWGEGVKRVMTRKVEDAYALLFPRTEGWGKFKVEGMEGVWSTNVVESFGLGVDLSWAAGENVAGLIEREIK